MPRIGAYTPETAQMIHDVVSYLKQSGFVIDKQRRNSQQLQPTSYIYIRNDSGEEIPPFGCVQCTGTVEEGGQNYITVEKPADTDGTNGWYLFNGIAPIANGEFGIAYDGPLVRMLTNGTAVTNAQKWQPTINAFTVEPGDGPFIAIGLDDIEPDVMRGFIVSAASGGSQLQGEITAVRDAGTGADLPYTGLKIATVTVRVSPCDRTDLIGTSVDVVDHSTCVLDLATNDLVGLWMWASEGVAASRDPEAQSGTLTPCHWTADDRCCTAEGL